MSTSGFSSRRQGRRPSLGTAFSLSGAVFAALVAGSVAANPTRAAPSQATFAEPVLIVQLPVGTEAEKQGPLAGGMLRAPYGAGARIVAILPQRAARILTGGFHSACDPDVSFDGKSFLFAGKRAADDRWNIYEMNVDGSNLRQITKDLGDCRSPCYQSTLFTLMSTAPWYQLTFVSSAAGTMDEYGAAVSTSLYSCKLDGTAVRRLTFNLSSDLDPCMMPDGRLALASWQRRTLDHGLAGRVGLFGVGLDGADYALLVSDGGRRVRHMPCATSQGLAVFVEAQRLPWDGAGSLGCVRLRRPLHSYRPVTREGDGLFHSPSALPDGRVLVSRRPADGSGTHGVYRLDPDSGKTEVVFDDPRWHDLQAKLVHPRPEPDGRSSNVTEEDPHGKLYCLGVGLSDLDPARWLPAGTAVRLRVLEGVPLRAGQPQVYLPKSGSIPGWQPGSSIHGIPPLAPRRVLGEVPIKPDGSFNLEVPANTAIELQVIDEAGMALRSCGWIWAKNHEPRGCIGCHEDGELTPENLFVEALGEPSILLCLPPERRRSVDFRRDVMPILEAKCAGCHPAGQAEPALDGGPDLVRHADGSAYFNRAYEGLLAAASAEAPGGGARGRYVDPGRARTSPLVWRIFGRNTSRPWDGPVVQVPVVPAAQCQAQRLTDEEKRILVEWIDLGALWDGPPRQAALSAETSPVMGGTH